MLLLCLSSSSTLSPSLIQSRISRTTSRPFFSTSSYLDHRTIWRLYLLKAASRLREVQSMTLSLIFSNSTSMLSRLREVSSSSCWSIPIQFSRQPLISFNLLILIYSSCCHCRSFLLFNAWLLLLFSIFPPMLLLSAPLLRQQQIRCVAMLLWVSSLSFLGLSSRAVVGLQERSVVSAVVVRLMGEQPWGTADSECCKLCLSRYCSQQSSFSERLWGKFGCSSWRLAAWLAFWLRQLLIQKVFFMKFMMQATQDG